MNARGIPAQSEDKNLEKEYSYTINEMTGEHVPYGEEPKHGPVTTAPPTGDTNSASKGQETDSSVAKAKQQSPTRTREARKED